MAEAARKTWEPRSIEERINALDWKSAGASLSQHGYAVTAPVLSPEECVSLTTMYGEASRFRSQIVMERYRFSTKREAVNFALRALAGEPLTVDEARRMRGSGWDGDLDQLKSVPGSAFEAVSSGPVLH